MIINQRIGGGGETASIFIYGNWPGPDYYSYATLGSKKLYAVWRERQTNPAWHGLPSAYQEVTYLQTFENAYIDTGVAPNQNTGIDIAVRIDFIETPSYPSLFGSRIAEGNGDFSHWNTSTGFYINLNNASYNKVRDNMLGVKYTYRYINKKLYINGEEHFTYTGDNFSNNLPIYLFGTNTNGSYNSAMAIKRIYYCDIYNSETIVRNFIPCYRISDNKPGLYDKINNVFYVNQNSGEDFIIGDIVPQYLEAGMIISPIRDYGTWVTTTTNGTQTITKNVLVDAAAEFNVELVF